MSVINLTLPTGVDPDEAKKVIAGVLANLAQGSRIIVVPVPGDTPDTDMPQIALAAVAVVQSAALNHRNSGRD